MTHEETDLRQLSRVARQTQENPGVEMLATAGDKKAGGWKFRWPKKTTHSRD